DRDVRIFAKRQHGLVAKGDLQAAVGSGAKSLVHVHRCTDGGGPAPNLRWIDNVGDAAHGLGSAGIKGRTKKDKGGDREEAYEMWQGWHGTLHSGRTKGGRLYFALNIILRRTGGCLSHGS